MVDWPGAQELTSTDDVPPAVLPVPLEPVEPVELADDPAPPAAVELEVPEDEVVVLPLPIEVLEEPLGLVAPDGSLDVLDVLCPDPEALGGKVDPVEEVPVPTPPVVVELPEGELEDAPLPDPLVPGIVMTSPPGAVMTTGACPPPQALSEIT